MKLPHMTAKRRQRAYDIACAGLVVAATYGLVNGEELDAWMYAAAALFNIARRNVSDDDAV